MAAIVKNGNVVGGGGGGYVEFEELSYADYQAGNYDKTKTYAIPDYPSTKDYDLFSTNGTPVGKLSDGRLVYMAYGDIIKTLESSETFEELVIEHGIQGVVNILSFEVILTSGSFSYKLPYFEGEVLCTKLTYVNSKSFVISNRKSRWDNYAVRYIMYYTKE